MNVMVMCHGLVTEVCLPWGPGEGGSEIITALANHCYWCSFLSLNACFVLFTSLTILWLNFEIIWVNYQILDLPSRGVRGLIVFFPDLVLFIKEVCYWKDTIKKNYLTFIFLMFSKNGGAQRPIISLNLTIDEVVLGNWKYVNCDILYCKYLISIPNFKPSKP